MHWTSSGGDISLGEYLERYVFLSLYTYNGTFFAESLYKLLSYMFSIHLIDMETYTRIRDCLSLKDSWSRIRPNRDGSCSVCTMDIPENTFRREVLCTWLIKQLLLDEKLTVTLGRENLGYQQLIDHLNQYKMPIGYTLKFCLLKDMQCHTQIEDYMYFYEVDSNYKVRLYKMPMEELTDELVSDDEKQELTKDILPWLSYCEANRCIYTISNEDDVYFRYHTDSNILEKKQGDLLKITADGREWYKDKNQRLCYRVGNETVVTFLPDNDKDFRICYDGTLIIQPSMDTKQIFKPYKWLGKDLCEPCSKNYEAEILWRNIMFDSYDKKLLIESGPIEWILISDELLSEPVPFSINEIGKKMDDFRENGYCSKRKEMFILYMLLLMINEGVSLEDNCVDALYELWKNKEKFL